MNLRSRHCLFACKRKAYFSFIPGFTVCISPGCKNEGTIPDILIWHSYLLNPPFTARKTIISVGCPFESKNKVSWRKVPISSCHRIASSLCFIHSSIHLFISISIIEFELSKIILHGSLLKQSFKLKYQARLFFLTENKFVGN